jgi:hypothetical protein
MLKLKTPPPHNFNLIIDLVENLDFEKLIGRLDDKGNMIENESIVEIDGKQCVIYIDDYFKKPFDELPCLSFIFKLGIGFGGKMVQQILLKKFPGKITSKTEVAVILYELKEIA